MVRGMAKNQNEELVDSLDGEDSLEGQEDDFFDDAQKDRYMTFGIGDQNYGIEVLSVTEIVGLQDIAVVPDVPHYVRGMMNLRGNVIPVVDIRLRFGLEEREYDQRTCVIVVTVDRDTVGMIVDFVNEVSAFAEEDISTPPHKGENTIGGNYISGLGKQGEKVTILLDINRLLHGDKVSA